MDKCSYLKCSLILVAAFACACDESEKKAADSRQASNHGATPDVGVGRPGIEVADLSMIEVSDAGDLVQVDAVLQQEPPCPDGLSRINGECVETQCEPASQTCREGNLYVCADDGDSLEPPMSGGCGDRTCVEGACRPIKHNIMVLFDTSESMNSCVTDENQSYVDCCGGDCPGEWPICETAERPLSRLGYSKRVLQRFFADEAVQEAGRFALLTFPQTTIPFNNACYSSIYDFSNKITGDTDQHETDRAWFEANRSEVVRVPFARSWSEDNMNAIQEWIDFEEDLDRNPELRATGLTPLGRSMFYAGEYLRHSVVVEGRECEQDVDCGSQDYVCVDGTCTDPLSHCRLNLLLVFTDGRESTNPLIDQFYNPVVQARRMKFGLKCEDDTQCLAGSSCDNGYCRRAQTRLDPCDTDAQCPTDAFCEDGRCVVPGFLWPTDQGRCAQAGNPCVVTANPYPEECAGFLETCEPIDPHYWDRAQGADVLRGHNGTPISVTTHVINVSDQVNESRLIASHGGGLHFQVNLNDEDVLLRVLTRLADYKRGGAQCVVEQR
ncbi:MAG: EB domain-containing protein [Bradymonadia bacterium]